MRGTALGRMLAVMAAGAQAGCIVGYQNTVAPPGLVVPAANARTRNLDVQLNLARNVAAGAHVGAGGVVAEKDSARIPSWLGLDLAWHHGLADGLALELRLPTSLLFPVPFVPVPNGASLAPVWRLRSGALEVYTSPRFIYSRGGVTTAGPASLGGAGTISETTSARALGLELPASFVVRGGIFAAALTPYVRGFGLGGSFEKSNTKTGEHREAEGSWATWGAGATLALELVFSWVRLALGVALEASGTSAEAPGGCVAAAGGACEEASAVTLAPQAGLTLSFGIE